MYCNGFGISISRPPRLVCSEGMELNLTRLDHRAWGSEYRETIIRLTRLISYAQGLHTATESYTRLVRQKRGANTEQTDQTTTPCGLQSESFLGRSDGAEGKSTHANTRATETTTTRMAIDAASEAQHMRLRLAGMHSADTRSTANPSSTAAPATGLTQPRTHQRSCMPTRPASVRVADRRVGWIVSNPMNWCTC
jgi:hypothetical protein